MYATFTVDVTDIVTKKHFRQGKPLSRELDAVTFRTQNMCVYCMTGRFDMVIQTSINATRDLM
jgi:hypothetical protein